MRSRKLLKKGLLGLAIVGLTLGLVCSLHAEVVISYDSNASGVTQSRRAGCLLAAA